MRKYSDIPVWETRKRLANLYSFRGEVVKYFNSCEANRHVDSPIENSDVSDARQQINLRLQTALRLISSAGVSTNYNYSPPPVFGGRIIEVDILRNIFNIGQFNVGPDTLVSIIERAIGVYIDDLQAARLRTINPLWWFGRFLSWFAHLPFLLIQKAGFDSAKAEQSLLGKLVALTFAAIPLVAAFLTILERLDFLDAFKQLFM